MRIITAILVVLNITLALTDEEAGHDVNDDAKVFPIKKKGADNEKHAEEVKKRHSPHHHHSSHKHKHHSKHCGRSPPDDFNFNSNLDYGEYEETYGGVDGANPGSYSYYAVPEYQPTWSPSTKSPLQWWTPYSRPTQPPWLRSTKVPWYAQKQSSSRGWPWFLTTTPTPPTSETSTSPWHWWRETLPTSTTTNKWTPIGSTHPIWWTPPTTASTGLPNGSATDYLTGPGDEFYKDNAGEDSRDNENSSKVHDNDVQGNVERAQERILGDDEQRGVEFGYPVSGYSFDSYGRPKWANNDVQRNPSIRKHPYQLRGNAPSISVASRISQSDNENDESNNRDQIDVNNYNKKQFYRPTQNGQSLHQPDNKYLLSSQFSPFYSSNIGSGGPGTDVSNNNYYPKYDLPPYDTGNYNNPIGLNGQYHTPDGFEGGPSGTQEPPYYDNVNGVFIGNPPDGLVVYPFRYPHYYHPFVVDREKLNKRQA